MTYKKESGREGIARLPSVRVRVYARNARLFALEKRVAILHRPPSEISSFIRSLSMGTRDRWCYHTSSWRVLYNPIGRDGFPFLPSFFLESYILLSFFSFFLLVYHWKIVYIGEYRNVPSNYLINFSRVFIIQLFELISTRRENFSFNSNKNSRFLNVFYNKRRSFSSSSQKRIGPRVDVNVSIKLGLGGLMRDFDEDIRFLFLLLLHLSSPPFSRGHTLFR